METFWPPGWRLPKLPTNESADLIGLDRAPGSDIPLDAVSFVWRELEKDLSAGARCPGTE